jgi:hypothetical protein
VKRNGETKHYETSWTFRTYDVAQLKRLLRSVPELEHVATFDFTYDIEAPTALDGGYLDNILVLRRPR